MRNWISIIINALAFNHPTNQQFEYNLIIMIDEIILAP